MNTATLIATALLDSEESEFMQSFFKDVPLRWEFVPGMSRGVLEVKRWTSGGYTYLGCVKQEGDRWYTYTVTSRSFYGRDSGHLLNIRHPYVSHVGPFDTREQAANKLWELYEMPR